MAGRPAHLKLPQFPFDSTHSIYTSQVNAALPDVRFLLRFLPDVLSWRTMTGGLGSGLHRLGWISLGEPVPAASHVMSHADRVVRIVGSHGEVGRHMRTRLVRPSLWSRNDRWAGAASSPACRLSWVRIIGAWFILSILSA